MVIPGLDDRIHGTTYPRDRAPYGSVPLGQRARGVADRLFARLAGFVVDRLRVEPGEVLVVRGDVPPAVRVEIVRALHRGSPGDPIAVFLPMDCAVHVEASRLDNEDRGYRETKAYGEDKATPARGVFTGVPDGRDPPSDGAPAGKVA